MQKQSNKSHPIGHTLIVSHIVKYSCSLSVTLSYQAPDLVLFTYCLFICVYNLLLSFLCLDLKALMPAMSYLLNSIAQEKLDYFLVNRCQNVISVFGKWCV